MALGWERWSLMARDISMASCLIWICIVSASMLPRKKFSGDVPLYIRPMCWSTLGTDVAVDADPDSTAFALCIEEASMAPFIGTTLTTTRFQRPTLDSAVVNAKAGCLYPNSRMQSVVMHLAM